MTDVAANAESLAPRRLTRAEFEQIRRLAYEKCGLDLRRGKEELVMARLGRQMREARFRSFDEYCRHVLQDRTGAALTAMIDALTTNFTGFFREPVHFEFLRQTVLSQCGGRVRIWSAACATGEEPYTIAMSAFETLGTVAASRVRILATDISTRALSAARQGVYAAGRCDGIPGLLAARYFLQASQGLRRVRDELKAMVEFRRLNLIEPFAHLGPFEAVFCRNVMIYFDGPTRESLVNRLAQVMAPGGWLFTGHAESLTGVRHPFEYVKPAIYRKPAGDGV